MLGEIVRRVTGQSLGQWFARHVADPLGVNFWIGLPAELDMHVVAPVWPRDGDAWAAELVEVALERVDNRLEAWLDRPADLHAPQRSRPRACAGGRPALA